MSSPPKISTPSQSEYELGSPGARRVSQVTFLASAYPRSPDITRFCTQDSSATVIVCALGSDLALCAFLPPAVPRLDLYTTCFRLYSGAVPDKHGWPWWLVHGAAGSPNSGRTTQNFILHHLFEVLAYKPYGSCPSLDRL
ncbi:hypothetical protein CERSUDRAFT_89789 [Gelatoporia subvermispora B]|uniref:Uncharacterized protein n=1 Tax=Ceriporiopsis subvermispora (strain B) TaxID=914234 RepID=M2RRZ7_CERS8|nr:hypothetical protein CERSUDRAFT_89789 [Gelatoporia subvermispora B]